MIPFDTIPGDLVPLTAYFKQLLALATKEQPLLVFLDSVDQIGKCQITLTFIISNILDRDLFKNWIGGAQDANKLAWIPTRFPPYCKMVVSCVNETDDPDISRDYQTLRRMIDDEDNFIEVSSLGEELASQVIRSVVPHD